VKLVQFFVPGQGRRLGMVRGDRVLDITAPEEGVHCALDLVEQGKTASGVLKRAEWLARQVRRKAMDWPTLQRPPSRRAPYLLIPLDPPEVWGAGGTERRSVALRDGEVGAIRGKGIADSVPVQRRPALFFKATPSRCVGPNAPVMIRSDSSLTAAEPGLAVVVGAGGAMVGFTACNGLSARDLAREDPLYLPQAQIYRGCCALGPCLVTADEVGDPHALQLRCSIVRDGRAAFSEAANTSQVPRKLEELIAWLLRDSAVPAGTVLSTGPSILVPDEFALREGDRVDLEVQAIGRLSNPVKRLKA
jgi:2-dehydro-3-deoxy-D-arabinonate dehydratase